MQKFKPIKKPTFYQEQDNFIVRSDYRQTFSAGEWLSKLADFKVQRQTMVENLEDIDGEIKQMEALESQAKTLLRSPAFPKCWELFKEQCDPQFQVYLDNFVREGV